jgi:hypothetical protein
MARSDTDEHGRLVASSVGIAVPKDETNWGYLSEVHGHGMNEKEAADLAEDLAAGMLGTTLGLEVDPNKAWSEKEQVYRSSGLIIRTSNITQTAKGKRTSGPPRWPSPCSCSTTTARITCHGDESDNFGGLPEEYIRGRPTPASLCFPCPMT